MYFQKKTTPQLLGHTGLQNMKVGEITNLAAVCLMHVDISSELASDFVSMYPSHSQKGKNIYFATG